VILCADIGGSFMDFAVTMPDGRLDGRQKVPTPTDDLSAFMDALTSLCAPYPGVPFHIAIAGICDSETGIVRAANIPCIGATPLAAELGARSGRSVLVANDADCFALAEGLMGAGRGHNNVFGVILGTGVGGGLVVNQKLVTGLGGLAGEWGHGPFVIAPPGAAEGFPAFACGCGQTGCIDTIGGARGLERVHLWATGIQTDSRTILQAWQEGLPEVARTMEFFLHYLSAALAVTINITGSSIIPVGGGLSNVPPLIDALDQAVRARILAPCPRPLVVPALFTRDAGLIGAACLTEP